MKTKTTAGLQVSGTKSQVEQVLTHLRIARTTDGEPTCQVCNEAIGVGDPITLYLHEPVAGQQYKIGQCRCTDHNDDLTATFTLGINELIIDGRVGQCHDHATRQSWPLLISPTVRLLSPRDTTAAHVPPEESDEETATSAGDGHPHRNHTDDQTLGRSPATTQPTTQTGGSQ